MSRRAGERQCPQPFHTRSSLRYKWLWALSHILLDLWQIAKKRWLSIWRPVHRDFPWVSERYVVRTFPTIPQKAGHPNLEGRIFGSARRRWPSSRHSFPLYLHLYIMNDTPSLNEKLSVFRTCPAEEIGRLVSNGIPHDRLPAQYLGQAFWSHEIKMSSQWLIDWTRYSYSGKGGWDPIHPSLSTVLLAKTSSDTTVGQSKFVGDSGVGSTPWARDVVCEVPSPPISQILRFQLWRCDFRIIELSKPHCFAFAWSLPSASLPASTHVFVARLDGKWFSGLPFESLTLKGGFGAIGSSRRDGERKRNGGQRALPKNWPSKFGTPAFRRTLGNIRKT